MMGRTNLVLAVLLVAVVIVTAVARVDYSRPNFEFLPEMKNSPAWTAYERNPNFADDRTMQAPVANTIARGELPVEPTGNPYVVGGEGGVGEEGDEAADQQRLRESTQRGGEVYRVFCISCHGATGSGDGPVSKRGLASPSLLTDQARKITDMQMYQIVTKGYDTKAWLKSMPALAVQISPDHRWDVVNYVNSLQDKAETAATPVAAEPAPEPQENDDAN